MSAVFTRFLAAGRLGVVRLLCDTLDAECSGKVISEVRDHLAESLSVLRRLLSGEPVGRERVESDVVMTAQFVTMACGGHAGTQAVCAILEGAGYAALAGNGLDAARAGLAGLLNAMRRDPSLSYLAAHLAGDVTEAEGGRLCASGYPA